MGPGKQHRFICKSMQEPESGVKGGGGLPKTPSSLDFVSDLFWDAGGAMGREKLAKSGAA